MGRLPNGLVYYVQHNDHPARRAELRLVVRAGSAIEDERQGGAAHLLEHMAFEGSTHFPGRSMWAYLERAGMQVGADVNAQTTFDETVYRLTVPTDSSAILAHAFEIVRDWAHGLTIDSAAVERERRIVMEEWRTRRGVDARLQEVQLPLELQASRYVGHLPIGSPSAITRATVSDVRRFYDDWYRPDLMAVVIVGDVDADSMVARIREDFSTLGPPLHPRRRPRAVFTGVESVPSTPPTIVVDSEAPSSMVSAVYRLPVIATGTDSGYRESLIVQLFAEMAQARLVKRVREANAPFTAVNVRCVSPVREIDLCRFDVTVPDSGVTRGLAALIAEIGRVRRDGFTPEEFGRAAGALLRRDTVTMSGEQFTSSQLTAHLVDAYLTGGPALEPAATLSREKHLIFSIAPVEVERMVPRLIMDSERLVFIVTPRRAPTLQEVAAVLAAPAALPIYLDGGDLALMARAPRPGHVTKRSTIDGIGAQVWTLSNGIDVILKPTTYSKGELLVAGVRDGGYSLVPDSELVPAVTAVDLTFQSGLGPYDHATLVKQLQTMGVHLTLSMSSYSEIISGSGPPDARALLELVFAKLTESRVDSAAFVRYRTAFAQLVAHRSADPGVALSDTLMAIMSDYSPNRFVPTDTVVPKLNRERSETFFREHFGDATGFTFVIVGAFDPDSLEPLVEQYLGGLPTKDEPRTWRDRGERPPEGIVTRVVKKGREPRATTVLRFLSRPDVSVRDHVLALALQSVLQDRLWERLRQQMTGVYAVTVANELTVAPVLLRQISLEFTADPERRVELTRAVMREIERLRRDGPLPTEIDKFHEEFRRQYETDVETNGWWLQTISTFRQLGWSLAEIPTIETLARAVTVDELRDAADRFLDPTHYVDVSLEPDTR
jgi:zinc protease